MAKGNVRKKGGKDGFSKKALVGTVLIVAAALLSFMLFDSLVPFRRGMPGMMMDMFALLGSLSFLIIAFSIILIYTYLKDYLELRSSFTLALLLAIVSFLMFGISSNPMVQSFFGAYGRPGFFIFMPYLFAALALGILAWVSNK
jgi:hypothetical protein